jgi:outer membrane protein OmpA-like peptidoglycan-associated protein
MKPLILLASLVAVGCSHPHAVMAPMPVAPPATDTAKAAEPVRQDAVSPNLAVSDSIAKQCKLSFDNVPDAPKFQFDDVQLVQQDRDVLDRVATCLTSGPLKGHAVTLVGRADPRGTEEYNLALGTRRAHTVGTYLERLGVASRQVAESTRGSTQAYGTDEAGWLTDRRVDLDLRD